MAKISKPPDWFGITQKDVDYIMATSLPLNQDIPDFVVGGCMGCFRMGLDPQCDGDPKKCPYKSRR